MEELKQSWKLQMNQQLTASIGTVVRQNVRQLIGQYRDNKKRIQGGILGHAEKKEKTC